MSITPILSKEFAIIYAGKVIGYATDFTLEINKEVVDITKLGDSWKNKIVDTLDFKVAFNAMICRGETEQPLLWKPLTAYVLNNYCIIAGNAYKANGATTGHNPTTDAGAHWVEAIEYAAGTTYALGALIYRTTVANEKRIYKSLQASNTAHEPTSSPSWWECISYGYEALLLEMRNNDLPAKTTIKPSGAATVYQFGDGVLTSLSASYKTGDKVTYSGSLEGTGALSNATTP